MQTRTYPRNIAGSRCCRCCSRRRRPRQSPHGRGSRTGSPGEKPEREAETRPEKPQPEREPCPEEPEQESCPKGPEPELPPDPCPEEPSQEGSEPEAPADPCPEEPERDRFPEAPEPIPSSRGPAAHVMPARLRPERRRPGGSVRARAGRAELAAGGVCHPWTHRGAGRRCKEMSDSRPSAPLFVPGSE